MMDRCTFCEAVFDTKDGGDHCNDCDSTTCPRCTEERFAQNGLCYDCENEREKDQTQGWIVMRDMRDE